MIKHRRSTILRLGNYLLQYRWLLLPAVLLTLCSNIFQLLGPMLSGYAIDAIQPGKGQVLFSQVFSYAGYMLLFFIASKHKLKTYNEFIEDFNNGYYNNRKICRPLQTIITFLEEFPEHKEELLEMFSYKMTDLVNTKLWQQHD